MKQPAYCCPKDAVSAYDEGIIKHAWSASLQEVPSAPGLQRGGDLSKWPRCDAFVLAAAKGDMLEMRRLVLLGVPVIALDGKGVPALSAVLRGVETSWVYSYDQCDNLLEVVEQLLAWGYPPAFRARARYPPLISALLEAPAPRSTLVARLLRNGNGRECEGQDVVQAADRLRRRALGGGLVHLPMSNCGVELGRPRPENEENLQDLHTAASLICKAISGCHPGKVRSAMIRLRRCALGVGRAGTILQDLYAEVHFRPGGDGAKAAGASFQAALTAAAR